VRFAVSRKLQYVQLLDVIILNHLPSAAAVLGKMKMIWQPISKVALARRPHPVCLWLALETILNGVFDEFLRTLGADGDRYSGLWQQDHLEPQQ